MRALLAIPLVVGCAQTGVSNLEGTAWRATTIGAALYFEEGYRERADERRVVVCDWDNGPDAGDFGTFYGSYSDETGLITYDDTPGSPLGVSRRDSLIELFVAGEGASDTTPYEPAGSWEEATRDAFFGACGQVCPPADNSRDVVTELIDATSAIQTKRDCRDYCTAAAGAWIDCMHIPDTGSGGVCDCTENPDGNHPF